MKTYSACLGEIAFDSRFTKKIIFSCRLWEGALMSGTTTLQCAYSQNLKNIERNFINDCKEKCYWSLIWKNKFWCNNVRGPHTLLWIVAFRIAFRTIYFSSSINKYIFYTVSLFVSFSVVCNTVHMPLCCFLQGVRSKRLEVLLFPATTKHNFNQHALLRGHNCSRVSAGKKSKTERLEIILSWKENVVFHDIFKKQPEVQPLNCL